MLIMYIIPHGLCSPLDVGTIMDPFYRQEHSGVKVKCLAWDHVASKRQSQHLTPKLSFFQPLCSAVSYFSLSTFAKALMIVCGVKNTGWINRICYFIRILHHDSLIYVSICSLNIY